MARSMYSSIQSIKVLRTIVLEDSTYGYAICKQSGLKEGTVYPILKRLLRDQFIEASWDFSEPQGPPRKRYRATIKGIEFLRSRYA